MASFLQFGTELRKVPGSKPTKDYFFNQFVFQIYSMYVFQRGIMNRYMLSYDKYFLGMLIHVHIV